MRSCVHYGDLERLECLGDGLGPVIPSIVHEYDGVLPPLRPRPVQLQRQLPEVDVHHIAIGVGLQE